MSNKKTPISSLKADNNMFADLLNTDFESIRKNAVLNKTNGRAINAKFIPLEQVIIDKKNPRKGPLSFDEIKNGPKLQNLLFDERAQELFLNELQEYFRTTAEDERDKKIEAYFSLALFAASIKRPEDLIHPISVYQENGQFHLEAGHRRTFAHYILNAKEIAAIIRMPPESYLEKKILQYKENTGRENYTLAGEIENIRQIVEAYEAGFKETVSVNKLTNLIPDLKRTKSAWLLGVMREMQANQNYRKVIEHDLITSLEGAYKVAKADKKDKTFLIEKALKNKEHISFEELNSSKKSSKKTAVRSPNSELKVKPIIKISNFDSSILLNFINRLLDSGVIKNNNTTSLNRKAPNRKKDIEKFINELIIEIGG